VLLNKNYFGSGERSIKRFGACRALRVVSVLSVFQLLQCPLGLAKTNPPAFGGGGGGSPDVT